MTTERRFRPAVEALESIVLPSATLPPSAAWLTQAVQSHAGPMLTPLPPSISLVKDINATPVDVHAANLTNVNGILFFTTLVDADGTNELWKSAGTAAGTTLVRSFFTGDAPEMHALTAVGNRLYFVLDSTSGLNNPAQDGLWTSDGTAAGTRLVKNFSAFPPSLPTELTAGQGTVFFLSQTSTGTTLWKSDGSTAGTTALGTFPFILQLTASHGRVFFVTDSSTTSANLELWVSDGTTAGTRRVRFLSSAWAGNLTDAGGTLFFLSGLTSNGQELWKSDGTAAGTVLVTHVDVGPAPFPGTGVGPLTAVGKQVYFVGHDSIHGYELWKSDGTAAGTRMVKDIIPGPGGIDLQDPTAVGASLFFSVNDGIHGYELWKTDGTAPGTAMVKDIAPGSVASAPSDLTAVAGSLYFTANDGSHGRQLWRSDGSTAGTRMLTGVAPSVRALTAAGSKLSFFAPGSNGADSLWQSDGTVAGTHVVKVVSPGTNSSIPLGLTPWKGWLYFAATDGKAWRVYRTDGTAVGTTPILTLGPVAPAKMGVANGSLFILADDGTNHQVLWKSDGTAAGTARVTGFPAAAWFVPDRSTFVALSSKTFFIAANSANRPVLWQTNGTASGTTLVKGTQPGAVPVDVTEPTVVGNRLFFTAADAAGNRQVWVTDGPAAGTRPVTAFAPNADSWIWELTAFQGILLFRTQGKLWKTDGTAAGTQVLRTTTGLPLTDPTSLTVVGSTVYLSANDNKGHFGLWKTNGMPTGAVLVKAFPAPAGIGLPSTVDSLLAVGTTLYFSGNDGIHGYELWKSNGTTAGTVMVKDLVPGAGWSNPGDMTVVGGVVYFDTFNPITGPQLWRTEGTAAGTTLIRTFHATPYGSGISGLATVGNTVFLSADDGIHGYELWKVAPAS